MDSIEILERLIGFATVSRDSNLGLIDYVAETLEYGNTRVHRAGVA